MNGDTFRVSNPAISLCGFCLNWGQLLKERICSKKSKFFPLKVDPILEGLSCPWKQTNKVTKIASLPKNGEKHGDSLIYLKLFEIKLLENFLFDCVNVVYLPVQMCRKSYCTVPGVSAACSIGVKVGISKTLYFLC